MNPATVIEMSHENRGLHATVLAGSGEAFGTDEVRRPWARSSLDGETSARAYAAAVAHTVESR